MCGSDRAVEAAFSSTDFSLCASCCCMLKTTQTEVCATQAPTRISRREPMAIPPGRRLGPYEILTAVGAGGMGEVYRARDTRLDRIVAIKVLPTHLAHRAELRERFQLQAPTIARLKPP